MPCACGFCDGADPYQDAGDEGPAEDEAFLLCVRCRVGVIHPEDADLLCAACRATPPEESR